MRLTKKLQKKIEKRILNKELRAWAIAVKNRDKFCVICGSINRLNSHHIIPRQIHKYRLDINNGITLCPLHHKYCNKISAHKNPFTFYHWLKLNRPVQYSYLVFIIENENN